MNTQQNDDESLLIDSLLRQLDSDAQKEIAQRSATDAAFRQLQQDLKNTAQALRLLPEIDTPADLAAKTLQRIRQVRQTEALIAREELGRNNTVRPTFAFRELVAVAASLLLIAAVFVPSARQARNTTRIVQCRSSLGQIGTALQAYASANNGLLPSAFSQPQRWLSSSGQPAVSNSIALFKLVRGGYASQSVFLCPGSESGQPFVTTPQMTDFPGAKNIHYSYQHTLGRQLSVNDPELAAVAGRLVILGDSMPFYRGGVVPRDQAESASSENHDRTGQNVLHLDMSAEWARQPRVGVGQNNIFLAEGIYDYKGDEQPVSKTDTFLLPNWSGPAQK